MDYAASSDAGVLLPPDDVKDIVRQCFAAAKETLAASRARKIHLNVKTARRQAERSARKSENANSLHGSVPKSILAVPTRANDKVTMSSVSQCPGGLSWVRVRSNMRAADQGKDSFFVPYIGESEKHLNFSNKLAADTFEVDERMPDDVSEDEVAEEEDESHAADHEEEPLQMHRASGQPARKVKNTPSTSLPTARRRKKISERVWARAAMRVALKSIFEVLGCYSVQPIAAVVCDVFGLASAAQATKCVTNIEYRERKYEEADREERSKKSYRAEMIQILNGSVKSKPSEILKGDSIPFFVCRQCYTYNCFLHGNHTAKPSNTIPDKTRKDSSTRQISQDIESRCEDRTEKNCWHVDKSLSQCKSWWGEIARNDRKAADVRALILELHGVFGADPCRIATLSKFLLTSFHSGVELTCCRVGYMIFDIEGLQPMETKQKNQRRVRKSPYRVDSIKTKRKNTRREDQSGLKGGLRKDFEPCKHSGPCTMKSCPCYMNGVNCEKYCSCNHTRSYQDRTERKLTCPNAFKGCSCKSSVACVSNLCICYSWKRECDPDLCRSCHECKGGRDVKSCENDGLLMGKMKRIVVGHSDTHGWGAFAASPIGKNEIIGEYVGEIVDQEHADRRGRLYDEVQYSFLFNITDDFALDSTRVGNKLRYCNHAFEPNCEARLMRVAGDIRVGLYAMRDIGKHEELFFDYKYKFGPDWAVSAKDEKLTRALKEKRNSVASAMKQASSNQNKNRPESSVANGKRDIKVAPAPEKKTKRPRTMHPSTRSQTKNEESEPPQRRTVPTTSTKLDGQEVGNESEQQSKPTSAGGHPVERPLSVWRGVLRRVVPRAAEVVRNDRNKSRNCPSSPSLARVTKPSSLQKGQSVNGPSPKNVVSHMDNEIEARESGHGCGDSRVNGYLGETRASNLDTEERSQSLRKRSPSVSPIDPANALNTGSLCGEREVLRKPDQPSSPKPIFQTSRRRKVESSTQRLRNQRLLMRQRLKEIFGSDDETDDDESDTDEGEYKRGTKPFQKEQASPSFGTRERKRQLGGIGDRGDVISSKRRRTALEGGADQTSSGRRVGIANKDTEVRNASSPFPQVQHVRNRREIGLDSERASGSRIAEKVNGNASRIGRVKQHSGEQRVARLMHDSSPGSMVERTSNAPMSLRYRTKTGSRLDRGRSKSRGEQPKQEERIPPGDRPHLVRTRQSNKGREQELDINGQSEQESEFQIPMVNLISDEGSESDSGSFDPKFF